MLGDHERRGEFDDLIQGAKAHPASDCQHKHAEGRTYVLRARRHQHNLECLPANPGGDSKTVSVDQVGRISTCPVLAKGYRAPGALRYRAIRREVAEGHPACGPNPKR